MADRIKNYQQEADQITTLKAIRTDLGVAPSSYTPDATVVTKDRVVTFSQAEEELVVLSDIEKGVKQQVVKGGIADKRITNIEKLLQGNLYDYQTDSSSAYTKSVPAGAMPYAGLESLGGKTVVWNQLVDSGTTAVATISGHKYYTLIDGTASIVTSDGTAITIVDDTADMVCDLTLMFGSGNEPSTTNDFTEIFGATHYAYNAGTLLSAGVTEVVSKGKNLADYSGGLGQPSDTAYSNATKRIFPIGKYIAGLISTNYYDSSSVNSIVATSTSLSFQTSTANRGVGISFNCMGGETFTRSATLTNCSATTMFFDVDGTYISTINAITFTTPSNARQGVVLFIPSAVNTTATASNIQLEVGSTASTYSAPFTNEYPIPTPIQNLEGYGWSAGSVSNYIDFERKVFVKRVGSYTFDGTETWYATGGGQPFYVTLLSDALYGSNKWCATNRYGINNSAGGTGYADTDKKAWLIDSTSYKRFYVRDTAYDSSTISSGMVGLTVYYPLATPVETDISAYLTDDNLISVESGGSLTFPNSNGDDYRIEVPSSETYMVDLQSAI